MRLYLLHRSSAKCSVYEIRKDKKRLIFLYFITPVEKGAQKAGYKWNFKSQDMQEVKMKEEVVSFFCEKIGLNKKLLKRY